jgi:hypothetical protein
MRASRTGIFRGGRIRTRGREGAPSPIRMHKPHSLLVEPLPGVFLRRSAAYWVLLHLLRGIVMLWAAGIDELRMSPAVLLPGGNPLVPALVVVLGMLQARRSDEDLYLANLGYGWPTIAAYLLAPAAALEAAATVARLGWSAAAAYLALPLAGLGQALAA